MKLYKILIVLFLLIISIGAIYANEDVNGTTESAMQDDIISSDSTCSFKDLNDNIASNEDCLEITNDYIFNDSADGDFKDGIIINKTNYVINGNNHVIDAKGKASIFNMNSTNVTINNLVLKNALNHCLNFTKSKITTNNVTFIDCTQGVKSNVVNVVMSNYVSNNDKFLDNGKEFMAINSQLSNVTVKNGYFKDNHGINWGLIQTMLSAIVIENTTFTNCTSNYATVINSMASSVTIKKSRFNNLVANVTSGALAFRKYANVLIDDCEFINVSSTKDGGAIFADMYIDGAHDGVMVINNTKFINCSSMFGGAIVQLSGSLNILGSSFTSNHADYDGGASL